MADSLNKYIIGDTSIYTASMSPLAQGTELRQLWQLTTFTNLKIRGNISFVKTIDKRQISDEFFDDTTALSNLGTSTSRSHVSIDPVGRIEESIGHVTEIRDLGQSNFYNNEEPFVEADDIERDPTLVITTHPLRLQVATSLVQVCASPASFDGFANLYLLFQISEDSMLQKVLGGGLCPPDGFQNNLKQSEKARKRSQVFQKQFENDLQTV